MNHRAAGRIAPTLLVGAPSRRHTPRAARHRRVTWLALGAALAFAVAACSAATAGSGAGHVSPAPAAASGAIAQVYYWRARPGMFDEYTRYVREVAEPIDEEARRRDAFLSVTTYMTRDTASAWTHMRVFILRDSAQLGALGGALDSAGMRLEPDSAKRNARSTYAATLRDRVGATTALILR